MLESIKELITVKYSEKGSRFRGKEEQAYIFFVDFLDECMGEFSSFPLSLIVSPSSQHVSLLCTNFFSTQMRLRSAAWKMFLFFSREVTEYHLLGLHHAHALCFCTMMRYYPQHQLVHLNCDFQWRMMITTNSRMQ